MISRVGKWYIAKLQMEMGVENSAVLRQVGARFSDTREEALEMMERLAYGDPQGNYHLCFAAGRVAATVTTSLEMADEQA